jgi:copper chaperone CopZ
VVESLRKLPVVTSAEANLRTGSVTVHYDRTITDLGALEQALREHCGLCADSLPDARALLSTPSCNPATTRRQDPRRKVMNMVARAAALYLVEKAVEQALAALLAGVL